MSKDRLLAVVDALVLVAFCLAILQMAQGADRPTTTPTESRIVNSEETTESISWKVQPNTYGQVECHLTQHYYDGSTTSKLVAVRKTYKEAMRDCGEAIDDILRKHVRRK